MMRVERYRPSAFREHALGMQELPVLSAKDAGPAQLRDHHPQDQADQAELQARRALDVPALCS